MTKRKKYATPRLPQSEEARKKTRAHGAVLKAIREGTLIEPQHCERCGRKCRRRLYPEEGGYPLHAHHADYDKPLEVEWLCRSCHRQHHHTEATHSERAESPPDKHSQEPSTRQRAQEAQIPSITGH